MTPLVTRARLLRVVVEATVVAFAVVLLVWAWRADASWLERHASDHRCLESLRIVRKVKVERVIAVVTALALLVVVRPRLGRLVARARATAGDCVRVGMAVVLALVVSEVVLRRPWGPPPPPPPPNTVFPPTRPNASYVWGLEPNATFESHAGDRKYFFYVNAEGNRARALDAVPDHSRPTIFVAGESIAEGVGVPYEETFAALLEDRLGVQVVDIAVQGFGADQAYLRTAEVIETYAHPIAVVTVFLPEQAARAEVEHMPHLRAADDGGLERAPPVPAWLRDLRLRGVFRRVFDYHGDREIEGLRAVARATEALARRRGAYALFVTTNFGPACVDVDGKPPWLFRTLFDDQGIPRVHVGVPPELEAGPGEPHPGTIAHRIFADAIERALRAAHVV